MLSQVELALCSCRKDMSQLVLHGFCKHLFEQHCALLGEQRSHSDHPTRFEQIQIHPRCDRPLDPCPEDGFEFKLNGRGGGLFDLRKMRSENR